MNKLQKDMAILLALFGVALLTIVITGILVVIQLA
jgi:hypothetical protein